MSRLVIVTLLILAAAGCNTPTNRIVPDHDDIGLKQSIVLGQMMSGFRPPTPGFDYEAARQRRLNHRIKFQSQLAKQRGKI